MNDAHLHHRDYRRIEQAIRYLDEHWLERPGLAELASAACLSPWHFNRLFHRWAGVTPKQYLQWLALDAAKLQLRGPEGSVLAAAYAAGCSGPGRLHDLFVSLEAMTPGEYREGGRGVTVHYGFACTPFGLMLVARTMRGVCRLEFVDNGLRAATAAFGAEWPGADLVRDDAMASELVARIWPAQSARRSKPGSLTVAVRGTNFQVHVWRALLEAGERGATTYGELASALGSARASRAVGGAVGANPIAWLIPCHRVLRRSGELGGYRWDPSRKRTMLAWEYARQRAGEQRVAERRVDAGAARAG
jgi:AraC family transcriptional regulator, regulatory protein of adaptative response / methylated-DNA-[protein]-cysteine methyltransferase